MKQIEHKPYVNAYVFLFFSKNKITKSLSYTECTFTNKFALKKSFRLETNKETVGRGKRGKTNFLLLLNSFEEEVLFVFCAFFETKRPNRALGCPITYQKYLIIAIFCLSFEFCRNCFFTVFEKQNLETYFNFAHMRAECFELNFCCDKFCWKIGKKQFL